jgi:hypothetical protein
MKRFKKSKKKGPVRAKKASADGIQFRSGLEKHTYLALKDANLFELYEDEVFKTLEGFTFPTNLLKNNLMARESLKTEGLKNTWH